MSSSSSSLPCCPSGKHVLSPTLFREPEGEFTLINEPRPASALQLSQLTHLPAGLARLAVSSSMGKGSHNKNKNKKTSKGSGNKKSARDGQTIAKAYYPEGPRPQTGLRNLNQTLTVSLMDTTPIAFSTSLTVPVYFATAFALSFFTGYTQYTALFDQYKIDEIEVWLESANQNNTIATCQWASCIDLDDATTPSSYDTVSMRQGALSTNILAGHYHRFKPHVAVAEYSGAFTSFGNIPSGWIDVASPSVQHYGLKASAVSTDGVVRNLALTVRAKISFRGPAI
jgi:hypothetical protein